MAVVLVSIDLHHKLSHIHPAVGPSGIHCAILLIHTFYIRKRGKIESYLLSL